MPTALHSVDVAIVGGGIAAAAAALTLRDAGVSFSVVAPAASDGDRIGESLSAAARPTLEALSVWEAFAAEGHLACPVTWSSWGSNLLAPRSAGENHGWSLDRPRFERFLWRCADLPERARRIDRIQGIHRTGAGFCLEGDRSLAARFVLDCSGRAGVVGRRLSRRQRHSHLAAVYGFLPQQDRSITPTRAVMIEARPEGWWYSSLTPDGRLVVALFSDADLLPPRRQRSTGGWLAMLQSAPYTWQRIDSGAFGVTAAPRAADAGEVVLQSPFGPDWAAAGDAAVAMDPLSAHGMTAALWTGRAAALAGCAALGGDPAPLAAYAEQLASGITRYRSGLTMLYRQERRFPDAEFWRRRAS